MYLEVAGIEQLIASAPALDIDLLTKENRLLEILAAEKKQGRKVAVFLEHTGTRDLLPVLNEKLTQNGFSPLILRSQTVAPEKREEWLDENLQTGRYDCLLCNPNLVKTGLDLLEFPTIIFFQCGYSVFTLRQASRRSWRIGQELPVRVFFMTYAKTIQEKALALIAQKMETSLAVEGVLSEQGLAALSESENSIVFELAKAPRGFYEWQKVVERKQPYFIRPVDGRYFAMAGLWDHWQGENGEVINSCAIITTTANTIMREIHDRMPVILGKENLKAWLDPTVGQKDLLTMLEPHPDSIMEIYPVSSKVNNPRNNGPECIARSTSASESR